MPRNSLILKESLSMLVPKFFIETYLNVLPGVSDLNNAASEMIFLKADNQGFR